MIKISTLKGTVIALILFSVLAISVPGGEKSTEVEMVLTISTFLFAILAGFLISRLNERYNQMRDFVAKEDALWLSLYRLSKLLGKDFSQKLADKVDAYYTTVYDYELGEYYKNSISAFEDVYKLFYDYYPKRDQKDIEMIAEMLVILDSIEETRNLSSELSREHVNKGQWITVHLLSVIIIFCLFYLQGTHFYSPFLVTILSTILALVIFTMRDLQRFRLNGSIIAEESGQEVLECMGKPRYYNALYLDTKQKLPACIKEYRYAVVDPKSGKKTITLVKNK